MIYSFTENQATAAESATSQFREYTLQMTAESGSDVITTETAYVYALANKPSGGSGLIFNGMEVREVFTKADSSGSVTYGIYSVEINYDVRELEILTTQAIDEVRTSMRASLVPIRVKQSRNVDTTYVRTGFTAVNNNNLVNINSDGDPEGVDVLFPKSVLSVSKVVDPATVTQSYEVQTQGIVGRTNSIAYRGREAGTLLCSNVSIQLLSDTRASIDVEFLYEPALSGVTIGGITGINKGGWQYLSPLTSDNDGAARIDQIEVHDFYYTADFATALGF